jgi:type I restriction enzyme S subunit
MSKSELTVDIPNKAGWPIQQVDSLCCLISRGTAPVYVEHSKILAIGQRCVASTGFAPNFARPHSHRAMRNVLRPEFGDVLLNSTGTGTIGRSVVFNSRGAFMVDGHVTVLRPRTELADSRWLNSVLRTSYLQRHLERYCFAGSTNQLELSRTPLRVSRLPTPHIDEQRAMGLVIETFDAAILETEAIIAKLKALKHGLLHDLLTRGISAHGELRPLQSEAPHLYKESLLGWIPKEWDVGGLGAVTPRNRSVIRTGPFGSSLKGEHWRESGRPVVTIGSLGEGKFIASDLLFVDERTANRLTDFTLIPGDVAFSRVADVGRSVVISENERGWIMSSNFMRISCDADKVRPHFLQMLLSSSVLVRKQLRATVNSAGRDVANSAVLMSLQFPWPSPPEQDEILNRVQAMSERLVQEDAELAKLFNSKAGLMDDLLTGRVRVTPLLAEAAQQQRVA